MKYVIFMLILVAICYYGDIIIVMNTQSKKSLHEMRRQAIYRQICQHGSVKVNNLADKLTVSEMTVRRDLLELERCGLAKRIHGGAVKITSINEKNFFLRKVENHEIKKKLAEAAIQILREGESIFLDAGTTCYELAKILPRDIGVTVVTNGLAVAVECHRQAHCKVILLGGILDEDGNTFGGMMALGNACQISVNHCFFSAAGFTNEIITNPGMIGTDVKKQMLKNARNRILVVDSSKYDKRGLVELCCWEQIDMLITDSQLPETAQNFIATQGVQVKIANGVLLSEKEVVL